MMQSLRQATKNTMFDKWLGAIKKDGGGSVKTNPVVTAVVATTPTDASPAEAVTKQCAAGESVMAACNTTCAGGLTTEQSGSGTLDGATASNATTPLGLSHSPEAMRRPLNEVAVYLAGAWGVCRISDCSAGWDNVISRAR